MGNQGNNKSIRMVLALWLALVSALLPSLHNHVDFVTSLAQIQTGISSHYASCIPVPQHNENDCPACIWLNLSYNSTPSVDNLGEAEAFSFDTPVLHTHIPSSQCIASISPRAPPAC